MKVISVIADVQFVIDVPDAFIPTVNRYFLPFSSNNTYTTCASFIVLPTESCFSRSLTDPINYCDEGNGSFSYRSGMFELRVFVPEQKAILSVSVNQNDCIAIFFSAFKWFFVFMVITNGGVPLHSSLVEYLGKGYLFAGPSGRGKSTIAKILSQNIDSIVCGSDEVNVFYKNPLGLTVYSTPFCSSNGNGTLTSAVNLNGVFFIEHSNTHKIESLKAAESFRRLSQNIYHVSGNSQIAICLMDSVAALSKEYVFYGMCFKNDPSIAPFFKQYTEAKHAY